jgi:iron complex outermembrane receptor protein
MNDITKGNPRPAATSAQRAGRYAAILMFTTAMTGVYGEAALAQAAAVPSQEPAAEAANQDGIADILVTARRREESLQSTPVSATVVTGADALKQNIRNFADLRGVVSNFEVVPLLSGGASFAVRGVGQTSAQVNADSKAGFYVDEMYVSRQEGNDLYFYDVGSLQVLKGPQGTLFGKNTTAGAILLTTNRPTDEFGGYVQARAGNFNRIDTEGAINVPIADSLYGRVSFRTQSVDGFIKHVLDDNESGNINNKSVRGQLRYDSSPLLIDLLGEYNSSSTDGGATIPIECLNTSPYVTNYNALHSKTFCETYPVLGKPYLVYGGATLNIPTSAAITDRGRGGDANAPFNEVVDRNANTASRRQVGRSPFNDTKVWTANARITYALTDDLDLRSISAFRRSHAAYYTPTLHAPNDIYAEYDNTDTTQYTQELTIGGTAIDGRLNFLAGGFYYYQKTNLLQDTGPDWIDPIGYVYDGDIKYQSYAAFAQASFKATEKLELTVGARYTYDKKSAASYVFYANNSNTFIGTLPGASAPTTLSCGAPYSFVRIFLGGVTNCAGAPFTASGKNHWDGFDPKFQISYQWTPEFFTYVTAAHGYNSGGFNQQLGSQPANGQFPSTYNPEKLWSYEAGFKADLFDRMLRLNVSGFYQEYSDIQSTVIVQTGNITSRQFQTAGSAREQGFEAEVVLRPIPELTLTGNASYLDQKYTKVVPGALFGLDTPISSAPKWQYSGTISYDFAVGDEGKLTPSANYRGISSKPACFTNGSATVPQAATCNVPGYVLFGARIDYAPSEDSAWRIALFGTNITDKVTRLGRTGFGGGMGVDRYTPGRPAEYGAEVTVRF